MNANKENIDKVLSMVDSIMEATYIERSLQASCSLYKLAIRMVADADGDRDALKEDCKSLLCEKHMADLTPEIMAKRILLIAKLPQAIGINAEGRVYTARIDNPLGDGSVWCALDISEDARKGLKEARSNAKAGRNV